MKKIIKIIIILLSLSSIIQCSGDFFDDYQRKGLFAGASEAGPDTIPPIIVKAVAINRSQVQIDFNEPLSKTSVENINKYFIQGVNRIEVTGAAYTESKDAATGEDVYSVIVDVFSHSWANRMVTGKTYTLLAQNVEDQNGNVSIFETTTFTGVGWVVAELSISSSAVVEVPDKINPDGNPIEIYVLGTDIAEYQYSFDGGLWSESYDSSIPISITGLSEGLYTLKVVGMDSDGIWQDLNNVSSAAFTIDETSPVATLGNLPQTVTSDTFIDISVNAGDMISYKYKINSGYWSDEMSASANIGISDIIDGDYTIYVIGKDGAGNWQTEGDATTFSWKVDTLNITSVLSNTPAVNTTETSIDILVSGSNVIYYHYKIDAGVWSEKISITESIIKTGLSEGSHTIYVRGLDFKDEGQSEDDPTVYSWSIDTIAPNGVTLTGLPGNTNPDNLTNDQKINIVVSDPDIVSYRYKLDTGSWSGVMPLTSHIEVFSLSEGNHTVEVSGIDETGNEQKDQFAATSYSWQIDVTTPTAAYSSAPNSVPPANLNLTLYDVIVDETTGNVLDDVIAYKYKLDNGSWSTEIDISANDTISLTSISEGYHNLYLVGRDIAGNWQSIMTPIVTSWLSDYTPPQADLTGKPFSITADNFIDITVGGSGVVAYKYVLDGVTGDFALATEYQIDTDPGITALGLTETFHTVMVIAKDAAGNWQSVDDRTEYTWEVNANTSIATLSNLPPDPTDSNITNITVNDVNMYKYKLDGAVIYGSATSVATPIALSSLSDGNHTLYVIGDNGTGWQTDANATTYSWTIDSTPPVAELTDTPISPTNNTELDVTVGPTGDATHYSYNYSANNGGAWDGWSGEIAAGTHITRTGLVDQTYILRVVARDDVGNWQGGNPTTPSSYTEFTWTVDSNVAIAEFETKPPALTNSTSAIFTVGPRTSLDQYKYKLDTGTWSSEPIPIEQPITIDTGILTDGSHTMYVIGSDFLGNWQAISNATVYNWEVDTSRPVAQYVPGDLPGQVTNDVIIDISVQTTDGVVGYKYKIDGGAWSSEMDPVTEKIYETSLSDGYHVVYLLGKDQVGNWQSLAQVTSYTWLVDSEAPTIDPGTDLYNLPSNPTTVVTANIVVGGTGVIAYKYELINILNDDCSGVDWNSISEAGVSTPIALAYPDLDWSNDYTICIRGRDTVENWSSTANYSWVINKLNAPDILDSGNYDSDSLLRFSWINLDNVEKVHVQVSKDPIFVAENILYEIDTLEQNVDVLNYIVTSQNIADDIQRYYARVRVSGLDSPGASDWSDWSDPVTDGIDVVGTISGIVKYTGGAIPASATVTLKDMAGNTVVKDNYTNIDITSGIDGEGKFSLTNVPIGKNYYRLVVETDTSKYASKNNVNVSVGENTDVGILWVVGTTGTGRIQGKVVDGNYGYKIGGVTVKIYDYNWIEVDSVVTDITTDIDDPNFEILNVNYGTYTIEISKAGYFSLTVDNVLIKAVDFDMGAQAMCEILAEPQMRIITLWGKVPSDLDMHLVGSTAISFNDTENSDPDTNRFRICFDAKSFDEGINNYQNLGHSTPGDTTGDFSTISLVQDVNGSPYDGYGPEAINFYKSGGAQYAPGIYTLSLQNWSLWGVQESTSSYYNNLYNDECNPLGYGNADPACQYWDNFPVTVRIYDANGLYREVNFPSDGSWINGAGPDQRIMWEVLKINVTGSTSIDKKVYIYNNFSDTGSKPTKTQADW